MGNGGSRSRARPPPRMTIPNFPYPKNIFDFLRSLSQGYVITYSDAGTVQTVPDTSAESPAPWDPSTTSPAPTTLLITTPPGITSQPAYSTTTGPTQTTNPQQSQNPSSPPIPANPPANYSGTPIYWVGAIQAMIFVQELGPLSNTDTLHMLYKNCSLQISNFMQNGTDPKMNITALIYFCTVITVSFEPFIETLTYNYLNKTYPQLFTSSGEYRKFSMVYSFSLHASKVFQKTNYGYIGWNDRIAYYMVPSILKSIKTTLDSEIPLEQSPTPEPTTPVPST